MSVSTKEISITLKDTLVQTELDEIVGASPALERFRRHLPSLSKELTPLIFIGEGGVGKSFLAAHIHAASSLSGRPLESINFSTLLERDQRIGLLGGEPPDLTTSRRSILELKTTVVLKHIECATTFLQDKLAESLAASTVFRLGSSERRRLSARVIFTFRNTIPLLKKEKRLTPKLLDTLQPLQRIYLPPLHERREDIAPLTRYYAMKLYDKFHHLGNVRIRGVSEDGSIDSDLIELLKSQRWEDNVRDLIAFIHSLVLFPFQQELLQREKLEVIKMAMMIDAEQEFSLQAKLDDVEHSIISRAVQKLNHHKTKVAQLLGLSERAIGRKINLLIILLISLLHFDPSTLGAIIDFTSDLIGL